MTRRWLLLLLLAACTDAAPVMPPVEAVIEVTSSGFSGGSATQIFADGRIIQTTIAPGGSSSSTITHATPASFAAASAVIAAEGRRTKAAFRPQPQQCLDYGIDLVRADPPIAGFDQVSTGCPDAVVSALMAHVLAALALPHEP